MYEREQGVHEREQTLVPDILLFIIIPILYAFRPGKPQGNYLESSSLVEMKSDFRFNPPSGASASSYQSSSGSSDSYNKNIMNKDHSFPPAEVLNDPLLVDKVLWSVVRI